MAHGAHARHCVGVLPLGAVGQIAIIVNAETAREFDLPRAREEGVAKGGTRLVPYGPKSALWHQGWHQGGTR